MEIMTTLFLAKLTQGLADFWVAANAIKARTKIVNTKCNLTAYANNKKSGVALVIGNAAYKAARRVLVNAVNDAEAITGKLTKPGFIVDKLTDCDDYFFGQTAIEFGTKLRR